MPDKLKMPNPYDAPETASVHPGPPGWYVWFYKLYWPAWWGGTALIAGSWFGLVPAKVGWVGFGFAGAATLGAYFLPGLAGIAAEESVSLDSRLLSTKGEAYKTAIERFSNGVPLTYDGVAFQICPQRELVVWIVTDDPNLEDDEALELATHAIEVKKRLSTESDEFRMAIASHSFYVSVIFGSEQSAIEICRVVDGKVERSD